MSRDLVGQIMAHEAGELSGRETLDLFGTLVASGMAWSLQGHYGRMAEALIEDGYLTPEGTVTESGRSV